VVSEHSRTTIQISRLTACGWILFLINKKMQRKILPEKSKIGVERESWKLLFLQPIKN